MQNYNLDTSLIELSLNGNTSHWTMRHAVEGVQIFGGIGSGKTSGSGEMIATKYLKAGFGGLVLTVKPDEKALWQRYCSNADRLNDLIVLEPGGECKFNFLEYESTKSESNEAITENIVDVLKTVIRANEQQDKGKQDDQFWESALDMLIFNVIDLCKLAYNKLSLQQIFDIVQTIPKPGQKPTPADKAESMKAFEKALYTAQRKINKAADLWFVQLSVEEQEFLKEKMSRYEAALLEALPEVRLYRQVEQFFIDSFISLSDKTRSIIEFIFTGFLFRMLRDPVYSLFSKGSSNVVPEDSLQGKIILINLPVKIYHKVGRDCQILFKYMWQRTMEKRNVSVNGRPVFLFADEAQHFLHEHDVDFQATARSSRICTVYLTQNMPNYYAALGGESGLYRVKSFMGTLATKIFHANADIETNNYASELIGDTMYIDPARSITVAENFSQTDSASIVIDKRVRPEEFVSMRTGGPQNQKKVDGIIHKQGNYIIGRQNYMKITFNQTV